MHLCAYARCAYVCACVVQVDSKSRRRILQRTCLRFIQQRSVRVKPDSLAYFGCDILFFTMSYMFASEYDLVSRVYKSSPVDVCVREGQIERESERVYLVRRMA